MKDKEVVSSVVDEFKDGMMGAFQVFPTILVQQYFNCLVVRHVIPKGVGAHELSWTYFGYADDDETINRLRLKQGNLVGPAGFVSLEDSEVLRSEEHTSELQSLLRNSYAVYCLKKQQNTAHTLHTTI